MGSRERYVVASLVAAAVLLSVVLSKGLQWVAVYAGINDPVLVLGQSVSQVFSYAVGLGTGLFVYKHPRLHELSVEVVDELSRVTWPTKEETGHSTIVVIVTVIICSLYLGVFDAVWLWVTDTILNSGVTSG